MPTCSQTLAAALALSAAVSAAPVLAGDDGAAPGLSHDPKDIVGGTYDIDTAHSAVTWEVTHLGLSLFKGRFNETSGTLVLDPQDLSKTRLDVTIRADSVDTPSDALDEKLKTREGFFETAQYPTITFKSTRIERVDTVTANVTGDMTFHGVTKPMTLKAVFLGVAEHPFSKREVMGFKATGEIKRSDFGITGGRSAGDTVSLDIAAELHLQ